MKTHKQVHYTFDSKHSYFQVVIFYAVELEFFIMSFFYNLCFILIACFLLIAYLLLQLQLSRAFFKFTYTIICYYCVNLM